MCSSSYLFIEWIWVFQEVGISKRNDEEWYLENPKQGP